jgi:hypothetical protein
VALCCWRPAQLEPFAAASGCVAAAAETGARDGPAFAHPDVPSSHGREVVVYCDNEARSNDALPGFSF